MNQQTNQTQHKLNSLIPMEDPDGNRTFVNQWDVKARQDDGWKVIGRIEHHTASVTAPVELLAGDKPASGSPAATPAGGDAVARERARVRAILKDADDDQSGLADKLIAEGKPEAEALQALAADRQGRKAKADAKAKAKGAGDQADAAAAPQK